MPMMSENEKLAAEINERLRAMAADKDINPPDYYGESQDKGVMHLYNPSAHATRTKIRICYVTFQGRHDLTVEEANKYLAWLKKGFVGTHFEMERGGGVKMEVKPYIEPPNEPTLVSECSVSGKEYQHPSWGTVGVSRVSGSRVLFGSSLRHQHFIRLSIGRASMYVDDSGRERISGKPMRDMIEVDMSEAQFGQMLSSMNMGAGVPCTIMYVDGEQMPDCPTDKVKERFHATIQSDVDEITKKLHLFEEELAARFEDSKPLTKAEKREILGKMTGILRGVGDKMPWVQKMFTEKLEEQVAAAKTEIDSFLQHKAQMLGFKMATNNVAVLGEGLEPAQPDAPKLTPGEKYECTHGYTQPSACPICVAAGKTVEFEPEEGEFV